MTAGRATDATTRFSGRVDEYVKARPSYPASVLTILAEQCGLGASSVVADLGSGTGIFTRLLLESGASVFAVEPNDEMRAAAEEILRETRGFRSVAGRAERTTLADASVDLVTAAQAFHWFDVEQTRIEMARILRPVATGGGRERGSGGGAGKESTVALIWNDRDLDATPFSRAYEELLLRHCPKYRELQGKSDTLAKFDALLGPGLWSRRAVPNEQRLDREGLVGRLLSSSYAPRAGEPHHDDMIAELLDAFDRHQDSGRITMRYATVVITGRPR